MDFFLGGEGELTPSDAAVALIVLDDGRYLLQLRDQKPKIFYPGHWGLFGGATARYGFFVFFWPSRHRYASFLRGSNTVSNN